MSSPSGIDKKPIASKQELIEWFEQGCTLAEKRLIGVEHEKPPFYLDNNDPVSFEGTNGRPGVQEFIVQMVGQKGWQPGGQENGVVIDISKDSANWTFEPGLQMETGGAPLKNVHQTAAETDELIEEAVEIADQLGFGMLAQGYHPTCKPDELPLMPKSRYAMLAEFVKANNFTNGLSLLTCTSTAQVNLGFTSEQNMVKMVRVALSLQPIVVALFANSPFAEGKLTGDQSVRSKKLYNNFGGRYGFMLPIAFDEGFGFDMFTDYALNTMPVMGIYKGNVFIDAKGGKFADFMQGKLSAVPGQVATMSDWQNHLNTIWPEVRVRKFLEMRGADNGPPEMIKALAALWVGLLYDETSLDAAYDMVKDWTQQEREFLRMATPNTGLQTPFLNTTVQDIARNCLAISEAGLRRRNILNKSRQDESIYLDPLHEIASSGLNWAQRLEYRYNTIWKGDISRLFNEMSYANNPSVFKAPDRNFGKGYGFKP